MRLFAISIIATCCLVSLLIAQPRINVAKPEDAGFSSVKLNKLNEYFQTLVNDQEIAGIVCLISRGDKVIYLQSYGYKDIEKELKMTNDAIFYLASMTKPFTSVAAMMLYEEGLYGLDDPVSDYIPELKNMKVGITTYDSLEKKYQLEIVDAEKEITIKQLLNHTAGFTAYWYPGKIGQMYEELDSKKYRNLTEFVSDYSAIPLVHQPGSAFQYGISTDILGLLIERISGKTLDQFFHDRIFQPLGMYSTGYNVPEVDLSRVALYYYPENGELIKDKEQYTGERKTFFRGASGVLSTAEDYFKFCLMILNKGEYNGKQLLKSSTVKLMTTVTVGENGNIEEEWLPGYDFGLGFAIRTNNDKAEMLGSLGELCWFGSANTAFWIDPREKIIGIVLTQSPWNRYIVSKKTRDIVYQALN